MANAKSQNQSVAEQLRKEQEETQARLKEQAQKRLSEVREQIGPLQQEESELVSFLDIEKPKPQRSSAPRQRRSRKGGTVQQRAVAVIKDNPGINATGVAEKIGIKPNYLYRVLGDAHKEKLVRKEGTGYHVVES